MTRAVKIAFVAPIAALLGGCQLSSPAAYMVPPPARDLLSTPAEITPGRLQYAREPDTFAPVLTERVAFPTQEQANNAFEREDMATYYPLRGPYLARQSGWKRCGEQDGQFGGRGEEMIVVPRQ